MNEILEFYGQFFFLIVFVKGSVELGVASAFDQTDFDLQERYFTVRVFGNDLLFPKKPTSFPLLLVREVQNKETEKVIQIIFPLNIWLVTLLLKKVLQLIFMDAGEDIY